MNLSRSRQPKNRLASVDAALKLDGVPTIAKRRYSDSRHQHECDEILDVITFLAEHKLLDKLPRYAFDSLDYFPSSRMDEADMRILLCKLDIMQENIITTRKIIEKNHSPQVKPIHVKPRFDLFLDKSRPPLRTTLTVSSLSDLRGNGVSTGIVDSLLPVILFPIVSPTNRWILTNLV